jgi:hydroxymethylbilane synthase
MAHLRIGSRGSALALWQANHIASRLRDAGHSVDITVIKTTGDKITDVPLARVGTKGMFTKEIEEALRAKSVDLAVHSLKDLPTELDPAFTLVAVLEREDPRDVFVSLRYDRLEDLPPSAVVGTSSLRRQAQLHAVRPDLHLAPLRGNVDTRLKRLEDGELQGIILAAAGLKRLGLTGRIRQYLSPEVMCPAAGQGALGIEIRSDDHATASALSFLEHEATRVSTTCERSLLRALGGGCQVPIGALATASGGQISLRAVVARPDGAQVLLEQQEGCDASLLGESVARALLQRGAQNILDAVYSSGAAVPEQP